jgi:hypothetical protein
MLTRSLRCAVVEIRHARTGLCMSVRAGPHGMDTRQFANVAEMDPVRATEARAKQQSFPVLVFGRIPDHTQRIVITDAIAHSGGCCHESAS